MPRLKTVFKIAGSLVALLLILLAGLAIYVNSNQEKVFRYITGQLKENINGALNIGNMESSIFRNFPNVSVRLHEVSVRDSLWRVHHQELFRAKDVFISLNVLSLIKGKTRIHKIEVQDANVHMYTDDSGYSNVDIFRKKDTVDKQKKKLPYVDNVTLSHVLFTIENKPKLKYFQFDISSLATAFSYNSTGWNVNAHINTKVRYMMFNTSRGGFLKGKQIKTHLKASYNEQTATITAPMQTFMLDNDKVDIGLMFTINQKPALFIIDLKAPAIKYRNVLSMLSDPITSKLSKFDFRDDIDVQAIIKGKTKYRDTPYVSVTWQIKNNTFITPGGSVTNCTFTGIFNNERLKGGGYKDDNALIELKGVRGRWQGIPFRADTLSISNIKYPVLTGWFTSNFDITKLNTLTSGGSFQFDNGQADINILYKGGVFADDTTQPFMYGYMQVKDVGMTYLPRGLSFTNSRAKLRFEGSDLFVDDVKLQRGSTSLEVQGTLLNFLNLYYTAPEKIIWDWQIKSPNVNLNEFIPALAVRRLPEQKPDTTAVGKIAAQLNKFLDASSVRMKLSVDRLVYRSFVGRALEGNIVMSGTNINVNNFRINHSGGKLRADVKVTQTKETNQYQLQAKIDDVEVNQFFTAFENFGQTAITDRNIYGRLSTDVDIKGAIKADGTPVPYSINGVAKFKYKNGLLINFTPFKSMGKLIFHNRNMDSIAFRDIENRFTIKGDKVVIYPMYIESNVLNIHLEGIYGINKTGTDINIDLPLRNPKKDELIENDELRHQRNMKGIVLHLKAVNDEDGKVKIKWNKPDKDKTAPKAGKKSGFSGGKIE